MILLSTLHHAAAAQPSDEVGAFLKANGMVDMLEIHLVMQLEEARSDEQRGEEAENLSAFYLEQIRTLDKESAQYARFLIRAWDFAQGYDEETFVDLRLELLISRYLPVEGTVGLHELLLDDPNDRARAVKELAEISNRLGRIEMWLRQETSRLERRLRSSQNGRSPEDLSEALENARRQLSLARYYIGWAAYSGSVLNDRMVSKEALEAFGWLLGAKGSVPTIKDLDHAALEYEHVARAAIGSALCKARNRDLLTARAWMRHVIADESVSDEIILHARVRQMQIEAMDGQWDQVSTIIERLAEDRGESLRVHEARLIAIIVLEHQKASRTPDPAADAVARLVLEDLVRLGEIGHILDLHRRYGSLPLIADKFLSQYASALMALEESEQGAGGQGFATASSLFARAMQASDADAFPNEFADCALKMAYCAVRADRYQDAMQATKDLIATNPSEPILEQARWFRIVALEMSVAAGVERSAEVLKDSITQYITAYPLTSNAARLLLRHGLNGSIDPQIAISSLLQLPPEDPAAIAARRMLVQLYYQRFRLSGRTDLFAAADALEHAEWIWDITTDEPVDTKEATARLSIVRIVLDIASTDRLGKNGLVVRGIMRGLLLVDSDPALAIHRDEILLRRVEYLLLSGQLDRAESQLRLMVGSPGGFSLAAIRMVFVAAADDWDQHRDSVLAAERVVNLGVKLIEAVLPPPPEPLGSDGSAIVSIVVRASEHLSVLIDDDLQRDLSYRMCTLVLHRGTPDEETLRVVARVAQSHDDPQSGLEAWLQILARYLPSEPAWYEARYESFRLMQQVDPGRAVQAMDQYRVLHPNPGPEPWGTKIQVLLDNAEIVGDG